MVAKITPEEMEGVPHHLFSLLQPADESFDIHHYRQIFWTVVNEIVGRGNVPVVVGGTNYYLEATLRDLGYLPQSNNCPVSEDAILKLSNKSAGSNSVEELGKRISDSLERLDFDEMIEVYRSIDPEAAKLVLKNDVRRLENTLKRVQNQVAESLGHTEVSEKYQQREEEILRSVKQAGLTGLLVLVLDTEDFPWLEGRLLQRIQSMVFKEGGLQEIVTLLTSMLLEGSSGTFTNPGEAVKYLEDKKESGVLQAIGYKEFLPFLEMILSEAANGLPSFDLVSVTTKARAAAEEYIKQAAEYQQTSPIHEEIHNSIQRLWRHTVQLVKKQQRYIKNRLLGCGYTKLLKVCHTLQVASVEQFKASVLPASRKLLDTFLYSEDILSQSLDGQTPGLLQMSLSADTQPTKTQKVFSHCDICNKSFVTVVDRDAHFSSKGHWKQMRSDRRRVKNEVRRAAAMED